MTAWVLASGALAVFALAPGAGGASSAFARLAPTYVRSPQRATATPLMLSDADGREATEAPAPPAVGSADDWPLDAPAGPGFAMSSEGEPAAAGEDEEPLEPVLEDTDVARTVWIIDIQKEDGSSERLQVLFDSEGKAIWEGGLVARTGSWSLRPDRLLFTRNFLLGIGGFKETYVASAAVDATDDLKLTTNGIVRGWAYFAPALKIGDFKAMRKATNVGS